MQSPFKLVAMLGAAGMIAALAPSARGGLAVPVAVASNFTLVVRGCDASGVPAGNGKGQLPTDFCAQTFGDGCSATYQFLLQRGFKKVVSFTSDSGLRQFTLASRNGNVMINCASQDVP